MSLVSNTEEAESLEITASGVVGSHPINYERGKHMGRPSCNNQFSFCDETAYAFLNYGQSSIDTTLPVLRNSILQRTLMCMTANRTIIDVSTQKYPSLSSNLFLL